MLGVDVIFAISSKIVGKSIGLKGLDLFNIVTICSGISSNSVIAGKFKSIAEKLYWNIKWLEKLFFI